MLVTLFSCHLASKTNNPQVRKKKSFHYYQAFNPSAETSTVQIENERRLAFDDVREEISLSSWRKPNWELTGNGVRMIGSRRTEILKREKKVTETYGDHKPYSVIRPYRTPWLTLSLGDLNWCDYTVSTTVKFDTPSVAGIAFRYLNPREHYAFLLDAATGKARLVLRKMNQESTEDRLAWDELTSTDVDLVPHQTYHMKAEIDEENNITCFLNQSIVIRFHDTYRENGKVALIADESVEFGPVDVEGQMLVLEEKPLPKVSPPQLVHELPLPGGDIQRRFCLLDVDSDGEIEIITAENEPNSKKYTYRCIEFDGKELWKIDDLLHPVTEGGDVTLQVFDINGDGLNELVITADFQIQVRDGKTGKLLKASPTPNQNPHFDSKSYKYPKLLGDALCPVKYSQQKPPGFYLKDRYTNIWLFDHNAELLWHKAMSTSHFPLPVDVDKDGIDEIMVNHTLLKSDGSVIWSLPLEDHVDNIAYVSLNPGIEPAYFYLAGGEMGLLKVQPDNGEIVNRFQLGHIQQITIGDFLPEKEGLELLTYTTWREDRIHYLFDKDLNMLSTWQGNVGGKPVPWGSKDGGELLIYSRGIVDPFTGRLIYPYDFGTVVEIIADKRWGNALAVTVKDQVLRIYASSGDSDLSPVKFQNKHLQSDYLPIVSTNLYQ